MSKKYQEYTQLNLPAIEREILSRWDLQHAFEKSVEIREGASPFVFYEGPPSANGMPGIHHVISRTLKDLVCRYKTMRGYQVKRKGGWDTHGLPVELGVEKLLGITKEDIGKKISVEDYNAACRREVLKYKDKWDELTRKMGYWVDLEHPYITFENNYIETLWWLLKKLYDKGLLYESVSIQPYSPAAGTGLSSHELNQPGTYKDVKDTSAVVMFEVLRNEQSEFLFKFTGDSPQPATDNYFLAWTTTPWTLPSNLGLTVGAGIEYVRVQTFNPYTHLPVNVILARELVSRYFKPEGENGNFEAYRENLSSPPAGGEGRSGKTPTEEGAGAGVIPWKVLQSFKGSELEGIRYKQLMPFEANRPERSGGDPFRVMLGDFVTTEDGTGIVHTAPAFGADDFKVGKKYGIGILTLVDKQGKFVEGVGEFSGRYIKDYTDDPHHTDVNVDLCVKLKKENRAFKIEKFVHSYPHCWRTDKPVIYYPLDAWFIKTTALKDRMVELNKTIRWKPAFTGTGRFGNWLENMVDWNLSRSRFWGTPLPVWRTANGKNEICIGSIDELQSKGKIINFEKLTKDFAKKDENLLYMIDQYNEAQKGVHSGKGVLKSILINKSTDLINQKRYLTIEDLKHHDFPSSILGRYSSALPFGIDLHKPFIDEVILIDENNNLFFREPDVVDVWFDSGAMPFAQWHFPFENREVFASNYPADFICEGVDQTRGWFYTLHAISALLKEEIQGELKQDGFEVNDEKYPGLAFRTVVSNGLVLDKNGNKMSKRLGNAIDPFRTIENFGADATRWYLITNAAPWDSLKFDMEGIKEVQRKLFSTLYNTYGFFAIYANIDGFDFKEAYIPLTERPEIDRWIISSLNSLIKEVTESLDDYEPTKAGRAIQEFVDEHLSNWYVRLCRRRFWKGDYGNDKTCAYQTLYECLEKIAQLMAPIAPFFADWLFNNLNGITGRYTASSVHHTGFPKTEEKAINGALEERMQLAQDISSLALSLRKKVNIRVRQPLQKALIPVSGEEMKGQLSKVANLIKAEVNVKELQYLDDTEGFIKKKIKPNYKALGARLGPKMKAVANAVAGFTQYEIGEMEKQGFYELVVDNEPVKLELKEVEILSEDIPGWTVASKGSLTVALDITVTPELTAEGNARELVNRIQKIRKDSGFELTDRIEVKLAGGESLKSAIINYNDYICTEILADSLELVPQLRNGTEIEVNDTKLNVLVNKKR